MNICNLIWFDLIPPPQYSITMTGWDSSSIETPNNWTTFGCGGNRLSNDWKQIVSVWVLHTDNLKMKFWDVLFFRYIIKFASFMNSSTFPFLRQNLRATEMLFHFPRKTFPKLPSPISFSRRSSLNGIAEYWVALWVETRFTLSLLISFWDLFSFTTIKRSEFSIQCNLKRLDLYLL